MKFKRVFLIVLDSLGVGEAIDAKNWDDEGSNTLGHILKYNPIDYQGFTPLIKACASQAYDVVNCLLRSKDINLNIKDKIGNSALHYLCEDEKYDIAIQIIKEGGNIEDKNDDGKTPIDLIKSDDIKSIIMSYLKSKQQE